MERLKQLGNIPVGYSVLKTLFREYAYPRNKIASLEKSGALIRLKRGVFVVAPHISGTLLSKELIANHLYGPSYVSMESALRFHGVIPESVYGIRSMTIKRSRNFENSVGLFNYINCDESYYAVGINQVLKDDHTFLIASAEKALCDLIAYTPMIRPRFIKSMKAYLEEDLRLDMNAFYDMKAGIIKQCAETGKKRNDLNNLIKLLKR